MNFHTLLLTNIGTTNSVIIDTTDCYGPIITVGGVGGVNGDFSHTVGRVSEFNVFLFIDAVTLYYLLCNLDIVMCCSRVSYWKSQQQKMKIRLHVLSLFLIAAVIVLAAAYEDTDMDQDMDDDEFQDSDPDMMDSDMMDPDMDDTSVMDDMGTLDDVSEEEEPKVKRVRVSFKHLLFLC